MNGFCVQARRAFVMKPRGADPARERRSPGTRTPRAPIRRCRPHGARNSFRSGSMTSDASPTGFIFFKPETGIRRGVSAFSKVLLHSRCCGINSALRCQASASAPLGLEHPAPPFAAAAQGARNLFRSGSTTSGTCSTDFIFFEPKTWGRRGCCSAFSKVLLHSRCCGINSALRCRALASAPLGLEHPAPPFAAEPQRGSVTVRRDHSWTLSSSSRNPGWYMAK